MRYPDSYCAFAEIWQSETSTPIRGIAEPDTYLFKGQSTVSKIPGDLAKYQLLYLFLARHLTNLYFTQGTKKKT